MFIAHTFALAQLQTIQGTYSLIICIFFLTLTFSYMKLLSFTMRSPAIRAPSAVNIVVLCLDPDFLAKMMSKPRPTRTSIGGDHLVRDVLLSACAC